MDSIAMHRVRRLHAPEDNGTSTDAKKDGHRAPQPPVAPKGSQLERLAARFSALHASQDDSTGQDTKPSHAMLWAQAFPASLNTPTPAPHDEGKSRADEDEHCDDHAETWTPDPEKAVPEERQPSPQQTPSGADTAVVPFSVSSRVPRERTPESTPYSPTRGSFTSPLPSTVTSSSAPTSAPSSTSTSASAPRSGSTSTSTSVPAPAPADTAATAAPAVRAFAMTHAAPPVAFASSGSSLGDAPSAVIDGIVSRLADFCADPAVFERGAWHVTVPLQTVLPDCVLHVALSHFDLTLRFETSSDSARNVLLQHASTLRDRLTALLKAKRTTPRGIEIIVI